MRLVFRQFWENWVIFYFIIWSHCSLLLNFYDIDSCVTKAKEIVSICKIGLNYRASERIANLSYFQRLYSYKKKKKKRILLELKEFCFQTEFWLKYKRQEERSWWCANRENANSENTNLYFDWFGLAAYYIQISAQFNVWQSPIMSNWRPAKP